MLSKQMSKSLTKNLKRTISTINWQYKNLQSQADHKPALLAQEIQLKGFQNTNKLKYK